MFTCNGTRHVSVNFVPHQLRDVVSRSKAGDNLILVLPNSSDQIRCDADVQRAISIAGENVNAWKFHLEILFRLESPIVGDVWLRCLANIHISKKGHREEPTMDPVLQRDDDSLKAFVPYKTTSPRCRTGSIEID